MSSCWWCWIPIGNLTVNSLRWLLTVTSALVPNWNTRYHSQSVSFFLRRKPRLDRKFMVISRRLFSPTLFFSNDVTVKYNGGLWNKNAIFTNHPSTFTFRPFSVCVFPILQRATRQAYTFSFDDPILFLKNSARAVGVVAGQKVQRPVDIRLNTLFTRDELVERLSFTFAVLRPEIVRNFENGPG